MFDSIHTVMYLQSSHILITCLSSVQTNKTRPLYRLFICEMCTH